MTWGFTKRARMDIVASQPCWLLATAVAGVLTVRYSTCLKPSDPDFGPVTKYLAGVCNTPTQAYSEPDEDFFFGEVAVAEYTVYAQCPSASVSHRCAYVTRGTVVGYEQFRITA